MRIVKILLRIFLIFYAGLVLCGGVRPGLAMPLVLAGSAMVPLLIQVVLRRARLAGLIAFFLTPVILVLVMQLSWQGEFHTWFRLVGAEVLAWGFPVWTAVCILLHPEARTGQPAPRPA